MIIDAHSHIVDKDWYPTTWWNELAKVYVKPVKKLLGMDMTPQQIIDQLLPNFFDPTGEKLIAQMKNFGIDMTVACVQDYGLLLGDPKVSIEEQNQIFAGIQKKYPKKILAFASVDPRRPNADKLIRRCFEEWKMSGLKLHPSTGFYPNSKEAYKLLDIAREFKKQVLFHRTNSPTPEIQVLRPNVSRRCLFRLHRPYDTSRTHGVRLALRIISHGLMQNKSDSRLLGMAANSPK